MLWLALVSLIYVHGTKGQVIAINARQISSVVEPTQAHGVTKETKCLVFMTDGRFVSTMETCKEVLQLITERK